MARRVLFAIAVLVASALPAAAQSISLSLRDGRVTLVTQNATPAAILAEWARQGQMKVQDGERVPGTPLTLQLQNVPEREALDIVLRGAAGYIAAPRTGQVAGTLSRFDRVIVMATSPGAAAGARTASARPASMPPPGAVVPNTPMVEEPGTEEAATVTNDAASQVLNAQQENAAAGGAEQAVSSTNFDYANPQKYFAARQAEQQAAADGGGGGVATAPQPAATATPFGATRSTPGMLPTPQPPPGAAPNATGNAGPAPVNPYGLPAGSSPGSSPTPSTMEPDRAKYINPYAPTPPRP